jgi:hypothetical protein
MLSPLAFRSTVTEVIADHASAFAGRPAVIFPGDATVAELSFGTLAGRGWAARGCRTGHHLGPWRMRVLSP